MYAVRRLEEAQKRAHKRKQTEAAEEHKNQEQASVTESVTNRGQEKRSPRTIEIVAKEQAVPRDKLAVANKLAKSNPEVAAAVEQGKVSLAEATEKTGITPKKKAGRKPKRSVNTKPNAARESIEEGVQSLGEPFADKHTSIIDRPDGIRIIECSSVIIYYHPELKPQVLLYTDQNNWWVGSTSDENHEMVENRTAAEEVAMRKIQFELDRELPAQNTSLASSPTT
ncbi:hypothetical protein Poly41_57070 [Novipirellula artificiosorum]|uniref:Uncharacterized protein n=2 Tax=Novipirellula artificiosorum TaxID=2528016 RepID=A0A5C6D5I8_9BACT|nr:hypothetical protein Poly41_57070 [Novipirellula artificiosorum]